jgi:hypothetical protein
MMRWRSYVGMPVLTYDVSAICQDQNLFPLEADSKDPVVRLSPSYTGDWLFRTLHYLAILSDNIKPWPMTLAPTNETIICEIMQKKDPKGKKSATMIWEYQG